MPVVEFTGTLDAAQDLIPFTGETDEEKAERSKRPGFLREVAGQLIDIPAYHLPGAIASAIEGSDRSEKGGLLDTLIERSRRRTEEVGALGGAEDPLLGGLLKRSDVRQLGPSGAFSLTGMGAGAAAGIPAYAAGPVAGYAAGGLASGKAAYNMQVSNFLRDVEAKADQESLQARGFRLSDAERAAVRQANLEHAQSSGLWEAIPEALSNVLGLKIITGPAKALVPRALESVVGRNILTRGAAKAGALSAAEVPSEIVTQMGQHGAEVRAGLQPGPERSFSSPTDWLASAKEVTPPTLLQTLLTGGVGAAGVKGYRAARNRLNPEIEDVSRTIDMAVADLKARAALPQPVTPPEPTTPPPTITAQPAAAISALPELATGARTLEQRLAVTGREAQVAREKKAVDEEALVRESRTPMAESDALLLSGGAVPTKVQIEMAKWLRANNPQKLVELQQDVKNVSQTRNPAPEGDGSREAPVVATAPEHVALAGQQVDQNASPAQIEAGVYQKGHMELYGPTNPLRITIETPKGGTRTATDGSWSVPNYPDTYGYVKGTRAKDGEQVDVHVGDDLQTAQVYLIDQINPDGTYDEAKGMLAFPSQESAVNAYAAGFSDGKGLSRIGAISPMSVQRFKRWLNSGKTRKSFRYVPSTTATSPTTQTIAERNVGTSAQVPTGVQELPVSTDGVQAGKVNALAPDIPTVGSERPKLGITETKHAEKPIRVATSLAVAGQAPAAAAVGSPTEAKAEAAAEVAKPAKPGKTPSVAAETATAPVSAPAEQPAPKTAADHLEAAAKLMREAEKPAQPIPEAQPPARVAESQRYDQPLVREVGKDFDAEFLHGTSAKNIQSLAARDRPETSRKKPTKTNLDFLLPPELNEFGAEMLLAEKRQPQQANLFAQGTGNALAVVTLQDGTRILDLSDEATRVPRIVFGNEPAVLQFFSRPAITDDFILWRLEKIIEGYKQRNPDWRNTITNEMDPASPDFNVRSWQENLVKYSRERGYGAVRFADETLLTDRGALLSARPATDREQESAATTRTYPGSKSAGLFTDRPTGAHDDAGVAPGREGGAAGITDFGEKIGGARKDYAETYRDRMRDAAGMDVATEPLSKSWPEPDYQKLLDEGTAPWSVAFAHAARDEVPTKPQQSWKLSQWVKNVHLLRDVTNKIMAGELSAERARELLADSPALKPVSDRAELYTEVGHDKSLKGVRISSGTYGIFNREKFDSPRVIWSVERKTKTTAMSRWPQMLAHGETRDEAITNLKKAWRESPAEQETKAVEFDIYSRRGTGQFFIGKKIGKNVITLKDGFATAKEARAWKVINQEELVKTLEKVKEVPNERRENNSPRVGEDHRSGADVTPERFSETFGFRGVEFGNYVEGSRRQADLNEAYDALMDLAGVIGVPTKALSLNGELALAFGARGMGGRTAGGRAAAAHYEPGKVVINLTKERGAGSLAHEWFHAVDNYFSRMRGDKGGFVTGSPGARGEGMRTEMLAAFNRVMEAVRSSGVRERSVKLDKARYNPYWGLSHEMAARSFESYVIAKLHDQNASNDYLANIVSQQYWDAAAALGMEKEGTYPYPADADMPAIRAAFDDFFKIVETRETDKGIALFSQGQPTTGISVSAVREALAPAIASISVPVTIHESLAAARQATGLNIPVDAKGFHVGGSIHLIADSIADPLNAEFTFWHETFHAGLAKLHGTKGMSYRQALLGIARQNQNVRVEAGKWRSNYGKDAHQRALAYGMTEEEAARYVRLQAIEEALANLSGNNVEISGVAQFLAAVQRVLRAIGLNRMADWIEGRSDAAALVEILRARAVVTSEESAQPVGDQQPAFARATDITDADVRRTLGVAKQREIAQAYRNSGAQADGTSFRDFILTSFPREAQQLLLSEPDIRFSRAPQTTELSERLRRAIPQLARNSMGEIADNLIYNYQDRFYMLPRIQERLHPGALPERMDPNLAVEAYPKIVAAKVQDFQDDYVKPFVKLLHDSKFTVEQAEEYVNAKDAPDRNREMKDRNPTAAELDAMQADVAAQRDAVAGDENVRDYIARRRELRQAEADVEDGLADQTLVDMTKSEIAALRKEQAVRDYSTAIDRIKALQSIKPFVGDNTALSGMSDTKAEDVIAKARQGGSIEALERVSAAVDAITAKTRQILVENGLAKPEEIAAWEAAYPHYVPRFRDDVAEGMPHPVGTGFNVRGRESKRATGSTKEVTAILAHVMAAHEAAIIRAEKVKADRALFAFAQTHPDPELWALDEAPKVRDVDTKTGLVVEWVDPLYKNKPNVLTLKIDGDEHTITFSEDNPEALRLAASMKNLSAQDIGEITMMVGKFTRFLATMNTAANPVFVARNFMRDVGTAFVNLTDTELADTKKQVFSDIPRAIRGFWNMARGDLNSEWAKLAREFRDAGGQTGFLQHYKDILARAETLEKQLADMEPGKIRDVKRTALSYWNLIEDANLAVENGVRLSAYVNARKAGLSQPKAISLASNLTVNFTKRGSRGAELNMWYMFMNASIQGTARLIKAMGNRNVQRILGYVIASGFLLDILNRALAGDDDDDGENDYDQLPAYTKANNFVFYFGRPVTIPMPYGYNFFASVGRTMSEALFRKNYSIGKSAVSLANVFVDAFSPMGQNGSLLQFAAPTIADPFVQWAENKNFAGNPLRKEHLPFGVPKPEYQMGFKSTSAPAKAIAEALNDLTGGNEVRPGLLNMNPSAFDFAVTALLGGAGRTYLQVFSLPIKAATGEEIQAREVPFANIFASAKPEYQIERKFFENLRSVQTAAEELKHYRGDPEQLNAIRRDRSAEIQLIGRAKMAQNTLERIRKRERTLEKNRPDDWRDMEKSLEDRKKAIYAGFNKRYAELRAQ